MAARPLICNESQLSKRLHLQGLPGPSPSVKGMATCKADIFNAIPGETDAAHKKRNKNAYEATEMLLVWPSGPLACPHLRTQSSALESFQSIWKRTISRAHDSRVACEDDGDATFDMQMLNELDFIREDFEHKLLTWSS